MRNLRFGGRRRPREEDEDMEALLDDTDGTAKRETNSFGGDDAPMLNGSSRRMSQQGMDMFPEATPRKGVWKYMSFAGKRSSSIALPASAIEEAEEEQTQHAPTGPGPQSQASFANCDLFTWQSSCSSWRPTLTSREEEAC